MSSITCIVGTTASGKTRLALKLKSQSPSIIISADSRQVYVGMDIVTGKDHPKDVVIHGIDLLRPDQPSSVAVWYDAISPHLENALLEDKQIIVVGGTGLYVRAITNGIETMTVVINEQLRSELSTLSVTDLQSKLKDVDPVKFASLNNSDAHNPRRLTRAIEIAMDPSRPAPQVTVKKEEQRVSPNIRLIGLRYYDNSSYGSKILERVKKRIKLGAIEETRYLLTQYDPDLQSMSAIGYRSVARYLAGEYSHDQMIESWVSDEVAYAKRQLTWFNKQNVDWYDRGRMSVEEIYGNLSG